MASQSFEFWFDFSCPYAYLASTKVEELAQRTKAEMVVKPAVLGGIFKARDVPQRLFETLNAPKAKHNADDLRRYAAMQKVPLSFPAEHPLRTITALRSLLVVGEPFMPLVHKFYEAYWSRNLDIGKDEVIAQLLDEEGLDGTSIVDQTKEQSIKDELFARTDEAIKKGLFGVPTFIVGDSMFWGQDRIRFVSEALTSRRVPPQTPPPYAPGTKVDFYFDYSSPYSYLGASRASAILGTEINWKPFLLGGLFKAVGTANVPLFEASEAKRKHLFLDCHRGALEANVPFQWPTQFPMNTVLPLRVTILAGSGNTPESQALVHAIYRAYWSENKNIMDPQIIEELCNQVGLDGPDLVSRANEAENKEVLKKNTAEAAADGAFGAPTTVVQNAQGRKALYWGNDRLEMAALAASGQEDLF